MKKIILLVIVFMFTGCSSDVVITVNGEKIRNEQVASLVEAQQLALGDQKIPIETIRKNVIDSLINQTLLKQEAEKEGLTISEKELDERHQATLSNWKMNTDMKKSLAAQGFTESNMKELLKTQMLIQALTQKISQVTDEEVNNYYKIHADNYTLYTIKQSIATTEQDAILALAEPTNQKLLTFPAYQLPYPIQQQFHSGHTYVTPEVVKIDDNTFWVFNIESIAVQSFEQVKDQILQAAQAEQQLNELHSLLNDLKSKATIS